MRTRIVSVLAVACLGLVSTSMPAAASPITLTCSASVGTRQYQGTVTVDSNTVDSLYVGEVITLGRGLTAKVTSVNVTLNSLSGTARLSNGQTATVSCWR
jgi:hypothetical protein